MKPYIFILFFISFSLFSIAQRSVVNGSKLEYNSFIKKVNKEKKSAIESGYYELGSVDINTDTLLLNRFERKINLNVCTLKNGVYIVQIISESEKHLKKLLIKD